MHTSACVQTYFLIDAFTACQLDFVELSLKIVALFYFWVNIRRQTSIKCGHFQRYGKIEY